MSLLVRPVPQQSHAFLTRPNTYVLKLPTGSDFYFSLPFDISWLRSLRPLELAALRDYLSDILGEVTNTMGHVGMHNVLDVRHEISDRLSSADRLTEVENEAWAAGHGFPLFGICNELTTFFWDWNAIHFECGPSVVAWYVRWLYDFQTKPCFERYAIRRSRNFEENIIEYDWWVHDGQLTIEWYCNRDLVCTKIYGASFRDYDEWRSLKTNLETYELDLLKKGTARLRNAQSGGWELVMYLNGTQTGTHSDTSELEHAYKLSPPDASIYFSQSQSSEHRTSPNSNSWDRCYFYQTSSETPNKLIDHVKPIQALATCACQSSRPHLSELFYPEKVQNNTISDPETQLSPTNEAQPLLLPSLHPFPESLTYCTHRMTCPKHTAPPPPPHFPAQTTRLPHPTAPKHSAPTHQQYQAYAEDDHDDGAKESIRAEPNSWRDV